MKQKRLISSLREKKRYVVFQTISNSNLNYKETKEAIINSFKELFGLEGLAMANPEFIEFNGDKGIIRVNNKALDRLRASFCFIRKINKEDVILRSLGVSGMLNRARNKFILGGGV